MQVTRFACPHCATPLRIRDRMHVGRQVHCPDCGGLLRIVSDGPQGFAALPLDQLEERSAGPRPAAVAGAHGRRGPGPSLAVSQPTATVPPPLPAASSVSGGGRLVRWKAALLSPVGVGWLVAGGMTLGLVLFLGRGDDDHAGRAAEPAGAKPSTETADPKSPLAKSGPAVAAVADRPLDPPMPREPRGAAPDTGPPPKPEPPAAPAPPALPEPALPEPALPEPTLPDPALPEPPAEPSPLAQPDDPPREPAVDAPRTPEAVIAELLGEPPVEAPVAVDVTARLEQRIVRFEQVRPVAAKELLWQIEEMCGVPIRYDPRDLAAVDLEKAVSLKLENTTVGEILETLLERVVAHYDIEPDGIRLRPGPAGSRAE